MKAVVIDDEAKARSLMQTLISEECTEIKEIFEAQNLLEGVAIIKSKKPDIVFLDIEMPEHSGLEIFDFIDKNQFNFQIIFVTAYNEYAVQAFQLSAIDYLLKPARPSKLKEAVEKAVKNIEKENNSYYKLEDLKSCLASLSLKKIGLPYAEGIKFVDYEDIIMMEADGMYTNVYLSNSDAILVSKPLRYFLKILDATPVFYKPHRSFLVNLKYIKEYIKKDGGYIVMENSRTVSISREKRDEFLTIIQGI